MKPFEYARPATLADATRLLARGAVPVAGGTDLFGLLKGGVATPARLVDLTRIDGLRGWTRERGAGLRIGALTPLVELEESDQLAKVFPIVREALADAATLQLRTMGTVGGNLLQKNRCWYFREEAFPCWLKGGTRCFAADGESHYHAVVGTDAGCNRVVASDLAPALIAHDARVRLAGARGGRTIALSDLFTDPALHRREEHTIRPGEVLTHVLVPEAALQRRGTFEKAMDRKAWSFALVSVAAAARVKDRTLRDVRIVLGGVAPIPWRAAEAEAAAEGALIDEKRAKSIADLVLRDAVPLKDNGYKVPLARELVRRSLLRLAA